MRQGSRGAKRESVATACKQRSLVEDPNALRLPHAESMRAAAMSQPRILPRVTAQGSAYGALRAPVVVGGVSIARASGSASSRSRKERGGLDIETAAHVLREAGDVVVAGGMAVHRLGLELHDRRQPVRSEMVEKELLSNVVDELA
jgi:hypothetical protein